MLLALAFTWTISLDDAARTKLEERRTGAAIAYAQQGQDAPSISSFSIAFSPGASNDA